MSVGTTGITGAPRSADNALRGQGGSQGPDVGGENPALRSNMITIDMRNTAWASTASSMVRKPMPALPLGRDLVVPHDHEPASLDLGSMTQSLLTQ